jgi:hypothetical protein
MDMGMGLGHYWRVKGVKRIIGVKGIKRGRVYSE